MATKTYKKLIDTSTILWRVSGQNPLKFNAKTTFLSLGLILVTLLLAVVRFVREGATFQVVTDTFHTVSTLTHVLIYWAMVVMKRHKLVHYNNCNIEQFWSVDHENIEEKVQAYATKMLKWCERIVKFYSGYACFAASFMSICAFFGSLILPCYVPQFTSYYFFVAFNNLTFFFAYTVAVAADCFIFTNIILLIVQFKLLNDAFLKLDFKKTDSREGEAYILGKIRQYVDHHNFLLSCCEDLSNIIGFTCLLFFSIMVLSLCAIMHISTQGDLIVMMKSLVFLLGLTVEIFIFYCLPAEILSAEATHVGDSIYFSNWYCCRSIPIRKSLTIILMRVHRRTVMSCDGFVPVNLQTLAAVFKTAYSLYTCSQNMKG